MHNEERTLDAVRQGDEHAFARLIEPTGARCGHTAIAFPARFTTPTIFSRRVCCVSGATSGHSRVDRVCEPGSSSHDQRLSRRAPETPLACAKDLGRRCLTV